MSLCCYPLRKNSFSSASQSLLNSPVSKPEEKENKSADIWTDFATLGEIFQSIICNFTWGTSIAESFSGFFWSEMPAPLYWISGTSFSVVALGSIYAHRKLNLYHQFHSHGHGHSHGGCHAHNHAHEDIPAHIHAHEDVQVSDGISDAENPSSFHHQDEYQIPTPCDAELEEDNCGKGNVICDPRLSPGQKAALSADFISHIGDFCGTFSLAVNFFYRAQYEEMSPTIKVTTQAVGIFLGYLCSYASVRSCQHAIVSQN